MSALLKFGPWAGLVLAALVAVRLYGDNRANEALALARADSLAFVYAQHDSLEVERDELRDSLQIADSSWAAERQALRGRAERADRRSRISLGRVRALLADTLVDIPDSAIVVITGAIAALEEERDVCQLELRTCDERLGILELRISVDSASLNEKDDLLEAFDEQLEDAIKARRRPCGIVCWTTRAAAAYGILELVRQFAGGDGGP